jgi:Type I phosphodiesterase / nucleotide pyrophosphatase
VPKKLVLAVIDGVKPAMLDRVVSTGRAPAMERLMREGSYAADCVSVFPSVTPACSATITTGRGPDEHLIPGMNWYHRGESRYVEYGSSLMASRAHGIARSITDTVYNMNMAHLSRDVRTVFETLDDTGEVRTAGTTYLIYRGRHRHEPASERAIGRLATATLLPHAVYGPTELFYADIFASRRTGCRGQLGMPGARDEQTGCVGAYMVEHDLFDFMLFSLPDNDSNSHRRGPHAQVTSIAFADRQIERLMHAAGGPDKFLEDHAVIVVADHSHSTVEALISLEGAFGDRRVLQPADRRPEEAELAVCPGNRSAQVYVLDPEDRDAICPEVAESALAIEGVDLVMRMAGEEGVIASPRGEVRFKPGGDVLDARGEAWSLEGDPVAVRGVLDDGVLRSPAYPDVLWRAWSALTCTTTGDVLLSADPGWEFLDWGGGGHVGKGTHGSMHRNDSESMLLWCGTGPDSPDARAQWSIRDVTPMVLDHFGVSAG